MLIGLVRDSVMQCFCHTCRAPVILPAAGKRAAAPFKKPTKIRAKQPKSSKKVKFITTEIRCQEKSKGGLCYEVILAEPSPNVIQPPIQKRNNTTITKNLSATEIEKKLKEAEERRLSLEAKKMADWSAKMTKIEEIARKKDELNNEFMEQTKKELETKMEHYEEKRDAILTDLKEKLKVHSQEIERTRNTLEQQKTMDRIAIEDKLKTAEKMRDEHMKKILERLKEHNTIKLAEVKIAADARETEKSMEKRHVFANKLYIAEMNRERELQKKLDIIRQHDRRAEMVRQNKAALVNASRENTITSSGVASAAPAAAIEVSG